MVFRNSFTKIDAPILPQNAIIKLAIKMPNKELNNYASAAVTCDSRAMKQNEEASGNQSLLHPGG
jgi:hypothetical protein